VKRNDEQIGEPFYLGSCVLARIFKRTMIPSKNYFFVGLTFWVLSACPLQAKDIVIATSSMTLTSVPYLVAIEKGFFEKEGLAAHYV
jgi:ABC-type nitrate/sulfonate/bicarbonate transport system substrate-binding protein